MKQTKKIRLVIEADVHQDTELTPEVVARIWGSYHNYPEMLSYDWTPDAIKHNQALLSTLLANPTYRQRFLIEALKHTVAEATDDNQGNFKHLAGLPETKEDLVETILNDLPSDAQNHFQVAQDAGVLWENTELARYSIQIDLTRISIEEAN